MLRVGDAGRLLVLERRRGAAAQRADDPREQHRERVAARVHHARLAQHGQQVGAARDRLLAGVERALDDVGDDGVLLLGRGVGPETRLVHVRELGRDPRAHLADDGEDRPLGGVAYGAVGLVGGARERGSDQHWIDELAGSARQLLGGSADQLREDHAGVSARAQQCRPGDGSDDLVATDVDDLRLVGGIRQPVELLQHCPQGQHHVVACVTVGDGEDVEVIDLLATRLERPKTGLDDVAEANYRWIRHRLGSPVRCRRSRAYGALVTLPAFRQRVQT